MTAMGRIPQLLLSPSKVVYQDFCSVRARGFYSMLRSVSSRCFFRRTGDSGPLLFSLSFSMECFTTGPAAQDGAPGFFLRHCRFCFSRFPSGVRGGNFFLQLPYLVLSSAFPPSGVIPACLSRPAVLTFSMNLPGRQYSGHGPPLRLFQHSISIR